MEAGQPGAVLEVQQNGDGDEGPARVQRGLQLDLGTLVEQLWLNIADVLAPGV